MLPGHTGDVDRWRSWGSRRQEQFVFSVILSCMAVVYLWDLSINGWSNAFYAAAVQADGQSWKAMFFGSFDPQNYITVDKPAGGLWLMSLSSRLFGFTTVGMLIPHVALALASAAMIRASVRRLAGPLAGLLAAGVFAVIPVVSVMFRHNNPEAPMIFGMVAAAYCTTRALDVQHARRVAGWMAAAGVSLGFAFLCKTFEALLVAPALVLVYAVTARFGWKVKLAHLCAAVTGLVVTSGWWIFAVDSIPATERPYVDNSVNNTEWSLAVSYNGLDRLLGGNSSQGSNSDGSGPFQFQPPGLLRMFCGDQAMHAAWLLPAACAAFLLGAFTIGRPPAATRMRIRVVASERAGIALLLWGSWLAATYLVLAYMNAGFHPYYASVMAPGIAATVAIGTSVLWQKRSEPIGRYGLAVVALAAGFMAYVLLGRDLDWLPWLRWLILAGTISAAAALALGTLGGHERMKVATVVVAACAALGGPIAFTIANVTTPKDTAMPTSGPAGAASNPLPSFYRRLDPQLVALIKQSAARWPVATATSSNAASIQLDTATPVMAIGGFSGHSNAITLQQFIDYAHNGTVRYYAEPIEGGGKQQEERQPGESQSPFVTDHIQQWIRTNYTPADYGTLRIYDLALPRKEPGIAQS
ncbi:glycosyltransferase family 39 protein [Mycobacteroides abscessus]